MREEVESNRMANSFKYLESRQNGCVVWFTGLSGAGKTTIANKLRDILESKGIYCYCLDGDSIRKGLCADLGYSEGDRLENMRRMAEVAHLFADIGYVTLVSANTPRKYMRELFKQIVGEDVYVEVFVYAKLETCINRDPKGLYVQALDGKIADFTGISSMYENPDNMSLVLDTEINSIEENAQKVNNYLKLKKII